MRATFRQSLVATSLLAALALGGQALAGPGGRCDHDGGPGWSEMRGDFKARAEKRLGDLKAGLKLRPEQEGAWKDFNSVLLAQAEEMQAKFKAGRTTDEATTALERIERVQKGADERRAALDAVAAATKTFYGSLDNAQKAFFDQNFRLMPGEHRRHHRRPA